MELARAPSPYDDIPIEEVWLEYQKTRSVTIRNYLWEHYIPLVRYNAERIYARLPDEVEIDDLMSAGMYGLMGAIDAYDLEREVKFETYCATRIRGAILDELRHMDWVPRLVRQRTARIEQARTKIEMETGRAATDAEICARLQLSQEDFEKYRRDGSPVSTISISRKAFQSDGNKDVHEIDVIKDTTQSSPIGDVQRRDLKDLMTKGLSRAERLIVVLYYYEGMTMKEIGATLDLSESRVSQMHSSILLRLKAQMQHRMREFE
ncbi:MAG: FliA/WhiG family RNA polymerase sigma factor [Phycisphaerales bacterium]|nr:FliA/WhiG family RNA polymerase sigma factor [Phycisphaerales bacterium]